MTMKIELLGMNKLISVFAKGGREATPAMKQALAEETQIMFRDSQRVVPVRDGTLRRSGILENPKQEGKDVVVVIGYGGAASAYALKQHEDLTLKHKDGQTAKYLETPVRERSQNLEQAIKTRIARILGGRA